jgi:hypothetical protein
MTRSRAFPVLIFTLICAASAVVLAQSALRAQAETPPPLPLQRQLTSPAEDPSGDWQNVAPVMPSGATGIMYTGFYENRNAWFDYENSTTSAPVADLPHMDRLHPFANPSSGPILLSFDIEQDQDAALEVYDVAGKRIARLAYGPMTAGAHSAVWDPAGCAEGIYFVTLTAGKTKETRKLVLLR